MKDQAEGLRRRLVEQNSGPDKIPWQFLAKHLAKLDAPEIAKVGFCQRDRVSMSWEAAIACRRAEKIRRIR
jgi:hypothetical protein